MEWRAIEVAPKDGAGLILWVISASGLPYWAEASWSPAADDWVDERGNAFGPRQQVTHWMIPEPPK